MIAIFTCRSIEEIFRVTNLTVADWIKFADDLSDVQVDEILDRVSHRGRSESNYIHLTL